MMFTSHTRSVFANSCLSTPRNLVPRNTSKRSTGGNKLSQSLDSCLKPDNPLELSLTPSTPFVRPFILSPAKTTSKKETNNDPSLVEGNERQQDPQERKEYAALFSTLLESNALLLEEIHALKHEQQSTLSSVQRLQNESERDRLTQSLPPKLIKDTWVVPSCEVSTADGQSCTSSQSGSPGSLLSRSDSESDSEGRADWAEVIEDIEPTDALSQYTDTSSFLDDSSPNRSPDSTSKRVRHNTDPFASPGAVAVDSMWDDFSVDDYALYDDKNDEKKSKNVKQWIPKITVPEPFAMTVRESQTPKQKSRSLRIAEQEQLKKAAEEEVELMKKFRATPVPASTFLPIYDLVNAKNEQRREEVKKHSKDILKSTEKPFSFTKREQELKQIKARQEALLKQIEKTRRKKDAFKAKTIPKDLFDPAVDEHIHEQEEYRKIRMLMRSEELLANSKLPGSMQLRERQYQRKKSLPESDVHVEGDRLFQPNINGTIPDYDQAYYEFQKKLAAKKRTKRTTATEPFHLRTESIPSRKQQVVEDMRKDSQMLSEDRWPFVAPRAKVSRKSPNHARSKTVSLYPAQMTETARLRKSLTQEKLASVLVKEINEQEERLERKERGKEVRKSVIQKSLSSDPTAWLEERKRQKLREFQKLDKERQDRYQHKLSEMQERVQSRPLLLEQASQLSARRAAEAKYVAALKKAGLSEQEIQALNQQEQNS